MSLYVGEWSTFLLTAMERELSGHVSDGRKDPEREIVMGRGRNKACQSVLIKGCVFMPVLLC